MIAEQYEVRFRLPDHDQRWFGDQARKYVAKVLDGETNPEIKQLFHRDDEGNPIEKLALTRFGGGKELFRITAIGTEAVENLISLEGRIRRKISQEKGRPIQSESLSSEVAAGIEDGVGFYRVLYPVVTHRTKQTGKLLDLYNAKNTDSERDEVLRQWSFEHLIKGIKRQANDLGIELPMGELPFHILDVGTLGLRHSVDDGKVKHASISYVDFMTTLKLKGHWAVGALTSRGYGAIHRLRHFQHEYGSQSIKLEEITHASF